MRILIVHNDYGVYSGEEAVVDRMIADGRRAGFEIEVLRRSSKFLRNSIIGKFKAFFNGMWSFAGRHMMKEAIESFNPDIIHIHNLYPLISPAALFVCRKSGIPVVMTVHNYRLICPTGLFLRNGKPCEECLRRGNEWGCIKHNCENDRFRSAAYALRNMVARCTGAYKKCVDYFCCLTEFQKEKLIAAGYDNNKIYVFPNYVGRVQEKPGLDDNDKEYVGYVGRLSYEKGYDLLVEVAKRNPDIEFRFAGSTGDVSVDEMPSNVQLCGQLSHEELNDFYRGARFIVVPSRCYEGFPVVLLEAFVHGKSCVAPNHGAFPDIMKEPDSGEYCGLLFEPLNTDDMSSKVQTLWKDPCKAKDKGELAFQNYNKRFKKSTLNKAWDEFLRSVANKKQSSR